MEATVGSRCMSRREQAPRPCEDSTMGVRAGPRGRRRWLPEVEEPLQEYIACE